MSDNKVSLSKNEVDGDQAGRDIYKPTSSYNFGQSIEAISTMSVLLQKFEEEREGDAQLSKFIEELDYYNCPYEGDLVGLEQKLKDGNRDDFISYALKAKESFHKKLIKYQLFDSAQRINVYLLALVESYFRYKIYPTLTSGIASQEVGILIQELVVDPLLRQLDKNSLGFTALEINGMLYFLTGNCHIKWTK